MRYLLLGAGLALVALAARAQVSDADWQHCAGQGIAADSRIGACTKLIDSGHLPPVQLVTVYEARGAAYYEKGAYDAAIADFTKAIGLKPGAAEPYNNRAYCYHLEGNDAKALADANKAVALAPKNADIIETRAEIYEKLGRREAAIADYRAVLKLSPNDQDAKNALRRLGAAP